ncbi:hypothetical protein H9Q72_007302 [Fusarium xylarioides]|uniref:Myb/SANT-like domain-containing protein n=1 Tax=Fusarium xylarioides TaxID=221167 RepID=A0A9P7L0R9_9HYPO|nr:hypothetical protein H9Q70_013707 [Fusarium xylarioides]KAG5764600.1 hypothetical protein H9Q72_007302 [Fusarium xylarioides]
MPPPGPARRRDLNRERKTPRKDIQKPGSKARWTGAEIEYLLESYGAKKVSGELENEKTQLMKVIHAKIGCELTERFAPHVFDQVKVGRKLGELLRNWKAFLAIMRETSGAGYDHELGIVTTTDEN